MDLLNLLSTTVESLQNRADASVALSSAPEKNGQNYFLKSYRVEEILLDPKTTEGTKSYLVKPSSSGNSWQPYDNSESKALIEQCEEKIVKPNAVVETTEVTKKNLEVVKEALKFLGGKSFGGLIVDWICVYRKEMLQSFGGDRKKLRYCVNGILSARVNSSIFEKKVYKENGTSRTEWMLADPNSVKLAASYVTADEMTENEPESCEDSNVSSANTSNDGAPSSTLQFGDLKSNNHHSNGHLDVDMKLGSTFDGQSRRTTRVRTESSRLQELSGYSSGGSSTSNKNRNLLQQVIKEERNVQSSSPPTNRKRIVSSNSGSMIGMPRPSPITPSNSTTSTGSVFNEEKDEFSEENQNGETTDFFEQEAQNLTGGPDSVGNTPQTYRGMIRVALEFMGGQATFESISKFIGTKFRDQLSNKAETWKHSIAGCLSVYFARKETKDASGKVIWTLGEPPKPKRRGRKRDRDDGSKSPEKYTKKKKEDVITISVEHLEALEEEIEYLKIALSKKKKEKVDVDICFACNQSVHLTMMLNCGHLFCGSIFCESSFAKQCPLCKAAVVNRLPVVNVKLPSATSSTHITPSNSNSFGAIERKPSNSNSFGAIERKPSNSNSFGAIERKTSNSSSFGAIERKPSKTISPPNLNSIQSLAHSFHL